MEPDQNGFCRKRSKIDEPDELNEDASRPTQSETGQSLHYTQAQGREGNEEDVERWISTFKDFSPRLQSQALFALIKACSQSQIRECRDIADKLTCRDFFALLPGSISLKILSYLSPSDLCRCSAVSRLWYHIANDPLIWKSHAAKMNGFVDSEDQFRYEYIAGQLIKRSWLLGVEVRSRLAAQRRFYSPFCPLPATRNRRAHDDHVITCMLFDGTDIITGSDDGNLTIWYADQSSKTLSGHRGGVWCAELAAPYVVSGSTDRTLRVWHMKTGVCHHVLYGHSSTVRCVATQKDDAISGSRDGTLRRWSILKGQCLNVYSGHTAAIRCVAVSDDFVVSGAYDCTVRVWRLSNGRCVHVLAGHENRIYSLQVAGDLIVSGSLDATVRLWNLRSGRCINVLEGHQSLISVMDLCVERNLLITGTADSTLRLWNVKTGECLSHLAAILDENKHSSAVTDICHNRHYIISSSDDGFIKLWDINTGLFLRNIIRLESAGNGGVIWHIRCTESTLVCAAGSRNGTEDTKLIVIDFRDIWLHYLARQESGSPLKQFPFRGEKRLSCGCKT